MVKSLEESVDALSDSIESYIEKKAQQSITGDPYGHPIHYTPECDFYAIQGCHTMLL